MSSNIGTPNNHLFPFGTDGKIVLGVPILKHFRVGIILNHQHISFMYMKHILDFLKIER